MVPSHWRSRCIPTLRGIRSKLDGWIGRSTTSAAIRTSSMPRAARLLIGITRTTMKVLKRNSDLPDALGGDGHAE